MLHGQQLTTLVELPGLETDPSAIPRGLMSVSRIKVYPGKGSVAYDMVAKSKEILTGHGATVRVFSAMHSMESNTLGAQRAIDMEATQAGAEHIS